MNRTPIPNCPQPETLIRERAWADGQRPEPKYSDAEINVLATECECGPSQAAVRYKTIAKVLRSLLAERAASRPSSPDKAGVSDADVEAAFKVMDEVFSSEFQTRGDLSDEDKAMAKRGIRAALEHFASRSAEAVRDGEDVAEFEVHAGGEYFSTSCGQRDAAFADAMRYVSTLDSEDGTPEVFEVTRRKIEIKEQSHD